MNIFYIDHDPKLCAEWAVDKHVVKMILEAAQLLSTAHRVLDGSEFIATNNINNRKKKWWTLPDNRNTLLYQATHINHPCAVWVRESSGNYNWAWQYLINHCDEYTRRYGKTHKVDSSGLLSMLAASPNNIPMGPMTPVPNAMEHKYIISEDPVVNYRNYYKHGKSHLHSWKQPAVAPDWIMEN